MDATAGLQEQRLFCSTGKRHGDGIDAIEGLALRPAVLARYRDLTRLRYDYPIVLADSGPSAGELVSLSSLVDQTLTAVAPRGLEGERLRKHVLRLEREIRSLAAGGARGRLTELWARAAERLAVANDPSAEAVLAHVAEKLPADGEVVDCDRALPACAMAHLWRAARERKARAFRTTVERLKVRLSDILRAAFIHSEAGQRPESLRASLAGTHRDTFDFDVMSKLLGRKARKDELPTQRRRRIEWALDILSAQPFFPETGSDHRRDAIASYAFNFDDCAAAAAAFHDRLPKLAEVVKAICIAELEADGRYFEPQHDLFFEHYDASALSAEDIALFPDYLVCIAPERNEAPENAGLMEMLSAGLPIKVLVEAVDLLEEASVGGGHFAFGVRSMRLANTATGLGGVFVVQSAGSNLYAMREPLARAFEHRGAALLCVYAGADEGWLPPYLAAAAAMESRAFPAFIYDPYAGSDQAARFTLADNPQPEADWPIEPFEFADEQSQRVTEETPFTVADYALSDPRYAAHFARVPRARWNPSMLPAHEWLARDPARGADGIPYVMAVDADDVMQRIIVDARLMQIVARSRTFWHRLQEQGGIHNSHAAILVAREKAKWEQAKGDEIDKLKAASGGVAPSQLTETAAATPGPDFVTPLPTAAAAPGRDPDEAWIETARCPSCNECQLINDRMFKYNENKQAYIADIAAGTYRQLVEAAEVCQVSIIHPGKPRDPHEPGLAELMRRADSFR